jgi:radical SAM superfamily enzyme YgiQ (UPF0313 family)
MTSKFNFETGVYRPPSEGGSHSLLLRVSRNCPWNQCAFCGMYKTEKFELRSVAEVKQDIDTIAAICEGLKNISWELGYGGELNREAVMTLLEREPELNTHHGFVMVFHWLQSGEKTAFLQDGNSLIMKTQNLVDILQHLRKTFPTIERVTTYARAKTISKKSQEDLTAIRDAGLDRLHVGLESGDDEVLKMIKKGVSGDEHIAAGIKALEAGFQLSEYWMPGVGGKDMSEQHARNTARVLSAINPHYVRSRPFFPFPGSPMQDWVEKGEFELMTAREVLSEIRLMVSELNLSAKVCFDHAGNYWRSAGGGLVFSHSYEGYQFPDEKADLLAQIDAGLKVQPDEPVIMRL